MTSVGRYLREQREAKGMSREEISRSTRVPVSSVERIENDQFDELPGEVFVRGFIRSFAKCCRSRSLFSSINRWPPILPMRRKSFALRRRRVCR